MTVIGFSTLFLASFSIAQLYKYNSIETHQNIIKGCDEILQQLNPEIVEKQRQEQENKALREEINSLKEMFREFIKSSLKSEQHGNDN